MPEPIAEQPAANLPAGIAAGLAAALLGALLWEGLTVATGYNCVSAAIGVGFLVGLAVRVADRGCEAVFGLIGALLSLLGCSLGNVMAACIYFTDANSLPVMDVLGRLSPSSVLIAPPIRSISFFSAPHPCRDTSSRSTSPRVPAGSANPVSQFGFQAFRNLGRWLERCILRRALRKAGG